MAFGNDGQDPMLRDYVQAVWQRIWIVLVVALALTGLAAVYSYTRTPLYEASAQLIYESQLNVADPLSSSSGDSSRREIELANVASVIASPELVDSANEILAEGSSVSSFEVEVVSDSGSDGSAVSTTNIGAVSSDAETAARAANAYAEAFVANRQARDQARVRQAIEVIQEQVDALNSAEARQSAEYFELLDRLQDLKITEATLTGSFSVLVPATVPEAPFSPQPIRNMLMGLVAGLVIGVGVALAVAQFDTRVRTEQEAAALLRMPLWGRVRKMPARTLDRQPLFVVSESNSPAAEAIRKLRGSLEFANVDGEIKSFFVTSALQGEGKSVTTCNLAIALAETGNRVVLVDGDLRRPQVHRYFELPNAVGVASVLTGKTPLPEALHSRPVGRRVVTVGAAVGSSGPPSDHNALFVLTSGDVPPNPAEIVASKSFAELVQKLEADFDMVVIDAPALLAVGDTAAMARCVGGLVFLVNLSRARRPLLLEAAAQISQMPCRKLGVVVIGDGASHHYSHDLYYRSDGLSSVSNFPLETVEARDSAARSASLVSVRPPMSAEDRSKP